MIALVKKKRNKISMLRLDDDDDNNDDNDTNNDNNYYNFVTPKKCNNNTGKQNHKKRKTTINHDLVLGAEFENEGTANADDEQGGDNNMDHDNGPMAEQKKCGLTAAKEWTMYAGGGGHPLDPVLYTGEAELFDVKLVDGYVDKMRNTHGVICFHKVFK